MWEKVLLLERLCQTHPEDLEAHLQRLPSDTMFVPTLTSPPNPPSPSPCFRLPKDVDDPLEQGREDFRG